MTSYSFLPTLQCKADVDAAIKGTDDLVVVLRFGRATDNVCMQLDHVLEKSCGDVAKMAKIFLVDVDAVPIYSQYLDITLIPATVFFFNGQHIKVDWGSPDHTKFIGTFKVKQHFIDVVETIFRGAMKGKVIVQSPLDPADITKYELIFKDI
ncbi:unnamed protein product [Owenia fusiformis]|uniref:Thioredoxin-like protein n=1 Tax=Owenia fusiformis TaxID=6347 RepID=A0A8J1XH71_OWEFU|nr:unnamed protein product [Owenia fusiformis]